MQINKMGRDFSEATHRWLSDGIGERGERHSFMVVGSFPFWEVFCPYRNIKTIIKKYKDHKHMYVRIFISTLFEVEKMGSNINMGLPWWFRW